MIKNLFILFLISNSLLAKEFKINEIKLSGLINDQRQEISGMDWFGDRLFLLPETPQGFLFSITKKEILNNLSRIYTTKHQPISPRETKFTTPDYINLIPGFDGFEAISFNKNNVYLSIEAKHEGVMHGYIVWGELNPNTLEINITENNLKKIETPIQLDNMSFESILYYQNQIIMLYEANGLNLQKDINHKVFSIANQAFSNIKSPNIEYRLTDATSVDNNRFWCINYFWPGEKNLLLPGQDPIFQRIKKGDTHQASNTIERIIEFEILNNEIIISDTKPILLSLDKKNPRNWEALARLDDIGLLIATDKHPRMIFGFIPFH